MSLLVVVVISLRGQVLDRREVAEILVPAALFSLASTAYALVAALLIDAGPLGFILLSAAGHLRRGASSGPTWCAVAAIRRSP